MLVDRIEVVRGASAMYGSEAAGGIVNIITRTGQAGRTWRTEVGTSFSTTHPGDSVSGRVAQSLAGTAQQFDYFAAAAFESTGGAFDGEGDRVPDIFPVGMTDNRVAEARIQEAAGRHALKLLRAPSLLGFDFDQAPWVPCDSYSRTRTR